jgi:outer membrane protein OmpA-like peptidoglycan-associated protein
VTELDKVTAWLKDNPNINVEIDGHTDSYGSDAYNQKLSENRAKSVYDYFANHGVDAQRLSYKGYGESQPIADNATAAGRKQNRRVELKIVK